jgi:hypothetical protein
MLNIKIYINQLIFCNFFAISVTIIKYIIVIILLKNLFLNLLIQDLNNTIQVLKMITYIFLS